ncbi:MAG TPA: MATE family efflux transporter [Vicinamibacteria bacterium]|nr:MATE family efflux transporter [Vicinamibacteria bacterium]
MRPSGGEMKDLTKGPVAGHILQLSLFIAMSTTFQTLYFLADLYFVGKLGKEAIAGVALGGNLMMLVLALTQSLGVGATALIAQAMGRQDRQRGERLFNQALVLSNVVGLTFGVAVFALRQAYCRWLAADAATAALGVQYQNWFIPALFLQFPLVGMSAALRGVGDIKVPTAIQIGTVIANIVLAPTLMFGWVTGRPLGVAGAGLASLVAVAIGCVAFTTYFRRPASPMRFRAADWRPEPRMWWEMLRIGLPAGGEFALMFVYMILVYDILRPFGAAAQAGFGIGVRVMQSLFLPAVAIAFATAPVAGQNFGARLGPRVRQAFYSAAGMAAAVMLVLTLLCHIAPDAMIRVFNRDPAVVAFGAEYLRIISWNFVASGVVFVSSSVFQGMGNTLPPLGSSLTRLLLFAVPAYALARQPGFQMRHVWYVSLASVGIQTCVNLWLLRREFDRKLGFPPLPTTVALAAPS